MSLAANVQAKPANLLPRHAGATRVWLCAEQCDVGTMLYCASGKLCVLSRKANYGEAEVLPGDYRGKEVWTED